ncbi:MAG TPA: hypothetical protein PKI62_08685 [bacterium]|nr:hypothetical protein [bacterium]HPR87474.1 hypothetical protein [bacterium]
MRRMLLALAAAFGLWMACTGHSTSPEAVPPVPRFVPAVPDTAAVEQGIDAVPEEDAILLQWRQDEALAAFQLFRRREGEKNYELAAQLTARDTTFLDRVAPNLRCRYYLRGANEAGQLSAPSDTLDYMLLNKATDLQIAAGDTLLFSWSIGLQRPAWYVLRLKEEFSGAMIWIGRVDPGYQGTRESVRYNHDGRARLVRLQSGVRYLWRLDCVGAAPQSGSESVWQRFILF